MIEEKTEEFLTELLMDVPIARKQLDEHGFLDVLMRAVLFYPIFSGNSSLAMSWVEQAEQLSDRLGDKEKSALVRIRRAVIKMRLNEMDEALQQIVQLNSLLSEIPDRCRCWKTVTLSRIHTRKRRFDLADRALVEAESILIDEQDWIAALPLVARGEMQLEQNQVEQAEQTFLKALRKLPFELIEDRIQVLQSLGFVYISKADAKNAVRYLDQARQALRGASAWAEVVQMNLVVGNFKVAFGETKQAEQLFTEALQICEQYPQPQLEPIIRVGLARSKQSQGKYEEAIEAVLEAAKLFAEQGQVLGFVGMIIYLSNIYLENQNYREAYRSLATGISIAKHLKLTAAESIFRNQVNIMRENTLGPEKFDDMVREMILEMKQRKTGKEDSDKIH